ncbi:RNA helicase [Stenotrophomonas rhizophila]|uniref:DEAD/DEAH box helicase n=1 Tax=Stenotrophomonas rhizophila TaxID=216778 RepID=UPI000BA62F70|nr:DEAD/DEAH box helicase [Stenotrophomonas rhizophila]PAK93813.1 RNA helicase [Stenotrophomonas rhizophila]
MKELTLLQLANTGFKNLYFKLIKGEPLDRAERTKLLAVAVVLINHTSQPLKNLAYRITLAYGNSTGDYQPLYDVSVNSGLIPVTAAIDEVLKARESGTRDTFVREFTRSYIDTFRRNGIVLTEQQADLQEFIQADESRSTAIVAPTSYGKSELILDSIRRNPNAYTLILVPSKALLAQTKKRVLDSAIHGLGKIVTHPEMYAPDRDSKIFVLTQERLARLLSEFPELTFDTVFIDEAHNLLEGDRRSELLATVISIVNSRSSSTRFKFLTPFLCNELNLTVRHMDLPIDGFRINEYIKSERFHLRDFRSGRDDGALKLYDQFLNSWVNLGTNHRSWFNLIQNESLGKNIVYGNRPKSIERFAEQLAANLPAVDCPLIRTACEELESTFDKRYKLVACLKRGVMYHHGSIPETVRSYLEDVFSKSKHMKYLVCNTTLLEGVNLPIERLFIIDHRMGIANLTPSKFKNLIGRVNRFSDTFSSRDASSLVKLEPKIYLLGIDGFTSRRAKLSEFFQNTVKATRVDRDSVKNVLLMNSEIVSDSAAARLREATDRLESLQPGSVPQGPSRRVQTKVGRLLIANSVNEIDVFSSEFKITSDIDSLIATHGQIDSPSDLMKAVKSCFVDNFDGDREYSDLKRLDQEPALNFYSMLLDWKLQKHSIKQSIKLTISYWNKRIEQGQGDWVFVGNWGDSKFGNSHREHWVNIGNKSDFDKINLAIVRLKEEDDFLDYKIFRFIEILNGMGAVEPVFYTRLKYGTTDTNKIKLIKEGFSRGLADLIILKYSDAVTVLGNGDIHVEPKLVSKMIDGGESDLLVFEAKLNLSAP